jgi:ribosomal-protein-alanine N-acetyltransferase
LNVTLRHAHDDDVARLVEIAALAFNAEHRASAMAEELARSWARVLVVDDMHRGVLAYMTLWLVADEVEVIQLATHPEARRLGLARTLVEHAIAEARRDRFARVLLEVRVSNTAARALYGALGFTELSRRERYYDDGEDALVLALTLA